MLTLVVISAVVTAAALADLRRFCRHSGALFATFNAVPAVRPLCWASLALALAASASRRVEKVRSVPLADQPARALESLSRREHFTADDDRVFCSATGGTIGEGIARKAFYAALDRAQLGHLRLKPKPIRFHDLRHTFGTLAVQKFPLTDVKVMMGHANVDTTMIYVHHVPRHDDADRLSSLIADNESVEAAIPA